MKKQKEKPVEHMAIIESDCYNCDEEIKVSVIYCDTGRFNGNTHPGPELYGDKEIELAKKNGVVLDYYDDSYHKKTYLANTCPHCGWKIPYNKLFMDYYLELLDGGKKGLFINMLPDHV